MKNLCKSCIKHTVNCRFNPVDQVTLCSDFVCHKKNNTRFMPNVKFKIPAVASPNFWKKLFLIIDQGDCVKYIGFCTNFTGDIIYNGFEDVELFNEYKSVHQKVSIYEAIPELIPEGMRYNKELNKLVPDITPADGFASGGFVSNDKLEFVGVIHGAEDFYTEEEGNVVLKHLFSKDKKANHRAYNVGSSNYAAMNIQPWDIWKDWKLDPWDADIIKRISRTKEIPGKTFEEARIEDYEKIKHICDEKISQLKEKK